LGRQVPGCAHAHTPACSLPSFLAAIWPAWQSCLPVTSVHSAELFLYRTLFTPNAPPVPASSPPQVYKALFDGVQVVAAKVLTGLTDERVFQSFVDEVGGGCLLGLLAPPLLPVTN
jgi:hypothetical protein